MLIQRNNACVWNKNIQITPIGRGVVYKWGEIKKPLIL